MLKSVFVGCRGNVVLSPDVLPADPPSPLFRTVWDNVDFGLRGRFWLGVDFTAKSDSFWLPLTGLDGLPFYRRWSSFVVRQLPAIDWR